MSTPDRAEVERALAAVLELPDGDRAAYLVGMPPAIRREVESLLAAHGRAGDFLSTVAANPPARIQLALRLTWQQGQARQSPERCRTGIHSLTFWTKPILFSNSRNTTVIPGTIKI